MKRKLIPLVMVLLCLASMAFAGHKVTLEWDANTEPDLAGYRLYYKTSYETGPPYDGTGLIYNGQEVNSPVDVGNVTTVTVELPPGENYIFALTAYDNEVPSLESGYSNEVMTNLFPAEVRNFRIIQILIETE